MNDSQIEQRLKAEERADRAKLAARRKKTAERTAINRAAFEANSVVSRSDQYFTMSQRPVGYMSYTDIAKAKREAEKWVQVGIAATCYGDKFPIYLPATN